jgi:hypothetical protein
LDCVRFGEAYGFLLFGGFGVPGLVDGAMLAAAAAKANNEAGEEFTSDMALSLTMDLAKAAVASTLKNEAPALIEALGVTAETVATSALIIVTGIFQSSTIGDEWLGAGRPPVAPGHAAPPAAPPAAAPAPPAPANPAPPAPAAPGPPPGPAHDPNRGPGAGPPEREPPPERPGPVEHPDPPERPEPPERDPPERDEPPHGLG